MRGIAFIAIISLFLLPPVSAQAEENCSAAYDRVAAPYWNIVSDMAGWKAVLDDYDRQCRQHYPDEMARIEIMADQLKDKTDREMKNTYLAINHIFSNVLSRAVPKHCANDKDARENARRAFLSGAEQIEKKTSARLKKSAAALRQTKENMPLCTQLEQYGPVIEGALKRGLRYPLLEISLMQENGRAKRHDAQSIRHFRAALASSAAGLD